MADQYKPEGFESPVVRETAVEYRAFPATAEPDGIDQGLAVLRDFGVNTSAKIKGALPRLREALKAGVPRAAFDRLRDDLGVSSEELAEVLGIPMRTLARRTERFKPDESERILRVGSVFQNAIGVLVENDAAARWMTHPKKALSGITPLRCCDTEFGAREVDKLLVRIAHGVFS